MRYPRLWTTALALAFVATAPVACGKKKKKSSGGSAPQVVDTFMVGSSSDGRNVTVQYKSNLPDAKFKCATEVDGQAGQWADCPAEGAVIPTEPGRKYVFKVKAVSAQGVEDAEPTTYTFTGSPVAGPEGPDDGAAGDLGAVIANKAEVGSVYTKRELKLQLSVEGAALDDVRLECKREGESTFTLCGAEGVYDGFGELVDGSSYTLTVRPVHRASGLVGKEDKITFSVELRDIEIAGADKLEAAKTGTHMLTFEEARRRGLRLQCSLDDAQPTDCTTGIRIELDRMQPGSHALTVVAQTAQGAAAGETTVNFCAIECSAAGGNAGAPLITSMQIGSFYEYLIPEDMHVVEYATTKTQFGSRHSFYRVMNDPLYLGNYACAREWDRRIAASSARGKTWEYCHSTSPEAFFKWLTDFRIANNHLEIATDYDLVRPDYHQRIMLNVFDAEYEFMHDRSRFEQMCLNKRGAIYRTKPIRFMERGFWGDRVKAEFYMCVAELTGVGPGLPSANDEWWVGAFFITSDGLDLPQTDCYGSGYAAYSGATADYDTIYKGQYEGHRPDFCGSFKNPSLVEAVYMTKKAWREPHDFARDAQAQFLLNLHEIVPILR